MKDKTEVVKNEAGYYVQRRGERCILYSPQHDPLCVVDMECTDYTDEDMADILMAATSEEGFGDN